MILVERKDEFIDLLFRYAKHIIEKMEGDDQPTDEELKNLPDILSLLRDCLTPPTTDEFIRLKSQLNKIINAIP